MADTTWTVLEDEKVRQIRYLVAHTCVQNRVLAAHFGINESNVSRIVRDVTHGDVTGDPEDMEAIEAFIRQHVDRRPPMHRA